ncbi:MAG: hypothetical protein IPI39_11850 [Candidatus Obscuribacter sp.]|nr:hypothetical protein [Candidatus Obscuribacter sp.]
MTRPPAADMLLWDGNFILLVLTLKKLEVATKLHGGTSGPEIIPSSPMQLQDLVRRC